MPHIALVTGAGQGLGSSIAGALFSAGYSVVITDRLLEQAQAAAAALDPTGERVMALRLDVSSTAEFQAALAAVLKN